MESGANRGLVNVVAINFLGDLSVLVIDHEPMRTESKLAVNAVGILAAGGILDRDVDAVFVFVSEAIHDGRHLGAVGSPRHRIVDDRGIGVIDGNR